MSSTSVVEKGLFPEAVQGTLTYWPQLSSDEQAFCVAYVENSYSLTLAADALHWNSAKCRALLQSRVVRGAVKEVQDAIGEIDFLNEKWVKAHLLRLMPMVMGDEPVPMVTGQGEEITACVFKPEIAMRIVEYVDPKKAAIPVNVKIDRSESLDRLSDLAERLVALQSQVKGRVIDGSSQEISDATPINDE